MICSKCGSEATNITPTRATNIIKVFGCSVCGNTFSENGAPVVTDSKKLADVFRAATEGNKTLQEHFNIDKLDPATKAIMTTKMLEYGVQMWFDGLKQGILLSTVKELYDGKVRS